MSWKPKTQQQKSSPITPLEIISIRDNNRRKRLRKSINMRLYVITCGFQIAKLVQN